MGSEKTEIVLTISLHFAVEERLNHGNDTFVCFVDLRKAFDSVNRDLLWHKLRHFYGIEGKFLAILQGMYEEVLSCVRVNRELSDWFTVEIWVNQGCILSPMLLRASCLKLEINEFGCYEVKIEESEKGRQLLGVEPRIPLA